MRDLAYIRSSNRIEDARLLREPNNLRERYRRYKAARIAYGFTYGSFREWALYGKQNPLAYSIYP